MKVLTKEQTKKRATESARFPKAI